MVLNNLANIMSLLINNEVVNMSFEIYGNFLLYLPSVEMDSFISSMNGLGQMQNLAHNMCQISIPNLRHLCLNRLTQDIERSDSSPIYCV